MFPSPPSRIKAPLGGIWIHTRRRETSSTTTTTRRWLIDFWVMKWRERLWGIESDDVVRVFEKKKSFPSRKRPFSSSCGDNSYLFPATFPIAESEEELGGFEWWLPVVDTLRFDFPIFCPFASCGRNRMSSSSLRLEKKKAINTGSPPCQKWWWFL